MTLHVFANEIEWVVAESIEDVEPAMKESIGAVYTEADEIEWIAVSDDAPLSIWTVVDANGKEDIAEPDQLGASTVEKTCRQWADQFGRGFLCSTEY